MPALRFSLQGRTVVALALWTVAVGAGAWASLRYESAAGSSGEPPVRWPPESILSRLPGVPHLVMFAHPRCPCTRASISELARLLTRCQDPCSADVVFLKPSGVSHDWTQTDLWRAASRIPGVRVLSDEAGQEQQRFGVATSGHVLVYDGVGRLQFSGGITSSRGHEGDSAGQNAILETLRTAAADRFDTKVFGCSLCIGNPNQSEPGQ